MLRVLGERGFDAQEVLRLPPGTEAVPPAIATVPSLNIPGLLHFVVWDGENVLDPACGPKRWPEDAPVFKGEKMPLQWASLIVLDANAAGIKRRAQ